MEFFVGNIPASHSTSQQQASSSYDVCGYGFVENSPAMSETNQQHPSRSHDVCGPYLEYSLKTLRPERCKCIFTFNYLLPPMNNYNITLKFNYFIAIKFRQRNSIR
jgi:hypothetical protein